MQELLSLFPEAVSGELFQFIMIMCMDKGNPNFCSSAIFFLLPKFSIEYDNILSLSERDHPSLTFVILAYEWMPTRPYSLLTRPGRHTGFLALDLAKLVPISGPLHSLLFHLRHGSLSSLSG